MAKFKSIDDYVETAPGEVRAILEEIRRTVQRVVPAATETIGHNMPAFQTDRRFFYFAAYKKHIGVYPPVAVGDHELDRALLPYRGEKGNLRFPLDQPIPYALIGRVAEKLASQYPAGRT